MRDDGEFSDFAEAAVVRLRQTAFLLSRDWHLAQDLTQITLAKVYLKWRRIDDPHAYAKKILLRAFLDHKRRRSSDELAVEELPEIPAADDGPDLRLTLFEALGRLPARDRAVVVLRYWEDLSVRDVAGLLGISEGNVKIQSMRSLTKLRALLGEDAPAGSAHRDIG
ncbi:SigE family RNA polymerase sigma factor [Actinoallomurus bryophytorum]|uniref:RNA polymerase sigma-70 factor (Sigma-E family) n=1 Tax=Actinoallomurus bryophytorum TaxID=1490222 RepID=A0A543CN03_9ACTN|nr:SigE family RNA polymerase sigma factor [Actinoallomurus bryophytorum]TQL98469.1 RNA polymerase sigma-70 factor (sigma-E family) [Actinoallomurus bryophytorum]